MSVRVSYLRWNDKPAAHRTSDIKKFPYELIPKLITSQATTITRNIIIVPLSSVYRRISVTTHVTRGHGTSQPGQPQHWRVTQL